MKALLVGDVELRSYEWARLDLQQSPEARCSNEVDMFEIDDSVTQYEVRQCESESSLDITCAMTPTDKSYHTSGTFELKEKYNDFGLFINSESPDFIQCIIRNARFLSKLNSQPIPPPDDDEP